MDIELYKKRLKEKGMTYEDLADKTGLSLGCIKRIMAGIAKYPRVDTIECIEKIIFDSENNNDLPPLSEREETLLKYFRTLSPELQNAAIDTIRVLAGLPAGGLQKQA